MTTVTPTAVDDVLEGEIVYPDLLGTAPADLIKYEPPLAPVTVEEAREETDWVHANLATYVEVRERIGVQFHRQDWKVLGYDSWFEFLDREHGDLLRQLVRRDRVSRIAAAHDMRAQGMSTRQIAGALDIGQTQVRRDLAQVSPNGSPEQTTPSAEVSHGETPAVAPQVETNVPPEVRTNSSPGAPAAAEVKPAPEKVLGSDGKQYPAKKPAPKLEEKPAEPMRPEDKPGYWSPEDRRKHEEEVQVRRDIAAAHRAAANIVLEFRTAVVTVVSGCRYGEKGLVTAEMIADLRKALDLLEGEL